MIKKKSLLILCFLSFLMSIFNVYSQNLQDENFSEKVKIVLRQVGNELLLENQDSTSLILPIKQVEEDVFQISFQKELSFEPNLLVAIVKQNISAASLSKNYRVQVLQCSDKEVAYSYEINVDEEKTIIPCAGRVLSEQCYFIEVRFLDKKTSKNNLLYYYIFIPLILGFLYREFYLKRVGKNRLEKTVVIEKSIGSFVFYPEQNKLVKKAKEITLSKKECELLEIFVANKNKVIKREELTKKVWEDNGVIVGRSLDTYISKLRKKLQEDETIKLLNVHGVGYKLEIS